MRIIIVASTPWIPVLYVTTEVYRGSNISSEVCANCFQYNVHKHSERFILVNQGEPLLFVLKEGQVPHLKCGNKKTYLYL